jgi:hypothetical protein
MQCDIEIMQTARSTWPVSKSAARGNYPICRSEFTLRNVGKSRSIGENDFEIHELISLEE